MRDKETGGFNKYQKLWHIFAVDSQHFKDRALGGWGGWGDIIGASEKKTSTGSVQSWPKEYFFVVLDISAAELLNTCCRDSADLLLPCCRGAAESPTDAMFYSAANLQQR